VRTISFLSNVIGLSACKGKGGGDTAETGPAHSSCRQLDDAGVVSRLDGLTSSLTDVVDLNGHCFENSSNNTLSGVTSMRFIPFSDDTADPVMHIQIFWVPPTETGALTAWAPEQLTKAECYDEEIADGHFCAHIDDNTSDDASDDVDLRAKTGSLNITQIKETPNGSFKYTGDLSMVVWGIDTSISPQAYTSPSVHIEGTFVWKP